MIEVAPLIDTAAGKQFPNAFTGAAARQNCPR
jgi:hypothetical protein